LIYASLGGFLAFSAYENLSRYRYTMSLPSWICNLGDKLQGKVASNTMCEDKKDRIGPRHIQLIVRNREELSKFLSAITNCYRQCVAELPDTAAQEGWLAERIRPILARCRLNIPAKHNAKLSSVCVVINGVGNMKLICGTGLAEYSRRKGKQGIHLFLTI
jgi:hypothetical protein